MHTFPFITKELYRRGERERQRERQRERETDRETDANTYGQLSELYTICNWRSSHVYNKQ